MVCCRPKQAPRAANQEDLGNPGNAACLTLQTRGRNILRQGAWQGLVCRKTNRLWGGGGGKGGGAVPLTSRRRDEAVCLCIPLQALLGENLSRMLPVLTFVLRLLLLGRAG